MSEGIIYFFSKPDPNRPIEEQYVAEINNERVSFIHEAEAMLYLFDNGISTFKRLTKETHEYIDISKIPTYEFWHVKHRVGYVTYGYEPYIDENDVVKKRQAFVWRFIGFGRYCFAKTEIELKENVLNLINHYNNMPEELGYNSYPYYTRYYREQVVDSNSKGDG